MNPISSVMLIRILEKMCTEINTLSLEYLLLTDGITLSRLMYGHTRKKVKYAAWVDHYTWLENARSKVSDSSNYLELAKSTKINKLISCCPKTHQELSSFENQFVRIFDYVFKFFWENNLKAIQNRVISCLHEMSASNNDIEYISTAENPHIISVYLVTKAKDNSGQKIQGIKQMKDRALQESIQKCKEIIRHNDSLKNCESKDSTRGEISSSDNQKIKPCTYFDLYAQGMSALDIINQLIANDNALFGVNVYGKRANNAKNWAEQLIAAPENWFFFCDGSSIIANWSCTFLSPDEEAAVQKGLFAGADFLIDSVNYPIVATDKEVVIYLHNISLNEGYQTTDNWIKLWKSFGQRLKQLLQSGITVKSIYVCLFRNDHMAILEQMGFKYLVDNSVYGKIYHLDLTQQSIAQFSWIMPDLSTESKDPTYLGQRVSFRQLSCDDELTEQQLNDIAGLIYDADAYVYQSLFSSRKQAKLILPMLFESNLDTMFNLDNIFCAVASAEKGERIIGIILSKKGPLNWNTEYLLHFSKLYNEKLPDTVDIVERNYFKRYNQAEPDARVILNVCVNSNFRMRDELRFGMQMMKAFLQEHPTERMELYVFQETPASIRLYLRNGFIVSEKHKLNGFSISKKELPCFFMYRPANPTN